MAMTADERRQEPGDGHLVHEPGMRDREAWRRLIDYALRCVEAESTKTLVPLDTRSGEAPWFPHDGPEILVTGRGDSIAAPAAVVAHLGSGRGKGSTGRQSLVYGWPAVVTQDRGGAPPRLGVTPLFVVHLERTRIGGEWTLTARNEPEFNLAALADRPEAADVAAEILALPLPFGDADGVAGTAAEVARLLGFHPPVLVPDVPERLDLTDRLVSGVYNAAVFIATDSTRYRAVLAGELRRLRGRDDWRETAAAWLFAGPGAAARRPTDALMGDNTVSRLPTTLVDAPAIPLRGIARRPRQRIDEDVLVDAEFVCGTAHRLQGAERDIVIFSSALTPNMPARAAGWIEQERNLLNVAVSRARRTLVVIGHPDLDARRSPTLASLREHMLSVRKAEGQSGSASAPVRTDSDAERLVLEAMRRRGLAPLGKITVEGFELDFAVMDGKARLNVEIDGDHHLDARRRQHRNDLARDAVLDGLGWRVLRVPAWRCHAEAEAVAAEIVSALERLH